MYEYVLYSNIYEKERSGGKVIISFSGGFGFELQ